MTYNWDSVRALSVAARSGSLTGAARELGVSVATLGRRIDALEAVIGLPLIVRSSSGVTATEAGAWFLSRLQPSLDGLAEIPRLISAIQSGQRRPPIRLSSTEPVLTEILAPNLSSLRDRLPERVVEFETSNAHAKLTYGEADLAIRMVRPSLETLIAKALPPISLGLYAHPSEIVSDGEGLPNDLPLFGYDSAFGNIAETAYLRAQGWDDRVVFRAGSVRTLLRAVQSGGGAAVLPDFMALSAGLVAFDVPAPPERRPWLVFHRDTRRDPDMKIVRRWVESAFRDRLG